MFVKRMLWGVCLWALASSAASAAGETFVAEGLVDPALMAAKTAGKSAAEAEELLLTQATFNSALHLGAYTRGIQFIQQPGPDGRYLFVTGGVDFQRLGGISPEKTKLRMLKSGLGLAEVTYGAADVQQLNLPKDLATLPSYRVKGEFQNTSDLVMSKIALHGKAMSEAYHAALVEHLAKLYPGKELALVRGRAFPVRVIEAELVPVATGGAAAVPSGAAAPASVPAAVPASSAAPASATAPAKAPAFDSKQYLYRVEMEVKIRLDEVKLAEEKAATSVVSARAAGSAAPAASATPALTPSSATSAVRAATP